MSVYQKDQLVWAKVKGYAWWPALVQKSNLGRNNEVDKEIHVAFIGEETHAVLPHDKIANFEEKFNEYSKVKTKKLQEALKIAQNMETITVKDKSPIRSESAKKSTQKEKRASSAVKGKKEESLPPAATQTASRPRGRPRKNPEATPAPKVSASTRKERSRPEKSQTPVRAQTVDAAPIMEIQTEKYPQDKAKESTKRQEMLSSRVTRSHAKQTPVEKMVQEQPKAPASARKGRKESVSKESKKSQEPQVLQKMVLENLDNQFKQPAAKPRNIHVEKGPERNLLSSINAEPSRKSYIEVTTRKETPVMRLGMNSAVPKIGEKRSGSFWLKEQEAPTYLSNIKPRELRNSATEMIMKKVRVSPSFQQKMSSVKATKLKDLQRPRNSEAKALVAYNTLMIRKFENDMEQLLEKLVMKFKNKQKLQEDDPDQIKLFNIINEFQKNKFDGSEFISSEVGKLFKTLHRLLISHRFLLSQTGNLLIVALAKVLQQVKEKIVRYCLDNTEYSGAFDIKDDLDQHSTGMENVDVSEIKAKIEERNENRAVNREQTISIEEDPRSVAKKDNVIKKEEDTPKFMGASSAPGSQQSERNRRMNWPSNRRITPHAESPALKFEEERSSRNGDILGDSDIENDEGSLMMLRKKIAIKLTKALQEGYLADKSRAQEAAIALEAMVYKCYPEMIQEYKKAIKALYQLIKTQNFTIEELADFRGLEPATFKEILRAHRREAFTSGRKNNFEQSNRMEYERQSSSQDRTRRGDVFPGLEESNNIKSNFSYHSDNVSPKDMEKGLAEKNQEKLLSLNRSSKRVQNY